MAKDDSSQKPDDPQDDAARKDRAPKPPPSEPPPGVGEKTEPDLLESTIESIEELKDPSEIQRGVGEKTEPNVLDNTVDLIKPTDSTEQDQSRGGATTEGVGEKTEPNLLESTIDSINPDDVGGNDQAVGNATVEDIGAKTEANNLDSTVESIDKAAPRKTKVRRSHPDDVEKTTANLEDTIAPFGMSPTEKTVEEIDLDQTVAFGATVDDVTKLVNLDESVVIRKGNLSDTHESGFEQTINLDEFEPENDLANNETVESVSPLVSDNIVQTINPRELSQEDAALWDSLAIGKSGNAKDTKAIPAIERSFTETKLQIRPRAVVTPRQKAGTPSDYRLIRLLGKGGMGNVFVARQESLDRIIAVKVIKPLEGKTRTKLQQTGKLESVETDRRHQFLSEAVVTGDLDHPNIVPIYDIAVTPDESLFYAMKRVVGTPWSKVLSEKTLDENVDILLKVADAIGFAHTRGVIHRDIKPENIMLGDFGVVMVMDWGLALAQDQFEKRESIAHTAGLGGTPAFMAPEMATGPIETIGPPADIYLLGATLFQLITGVPPHQAENVSACIRAVATNSIREISPEHHGELMNIALKAMATDPRNRYADVPAFQTAIREYRSHLESIMLASRAAEDLKRGRAKRDYSDFSRATYGYEEAIALWSGNEIAKAGLAETKLAHADSAYENGDFDLGLSILDPSNEAHQSSILKLQEGLRERELRQSRLVLFKRVAAAMLGFILVGGSVALYLINDQRNKAQIAQKSAVNSAQEARSAALEEKVQRDIADAKTIEANENYAIAVAKTKEALEQKLAADISAKEAREAKIAADMSANEAREAKVAADESAASERKQKEFAKQQQRIAEDQTVIAKKAAAEALRQKKNVEYEVYLSQIGLAKARIESNEFDDARRILGSLKTTRGTKNLGWEWRWLWRQANQSKSADKAKAGAIDLAVSRSGRNGAVVLDDGTVELITIEPDGTVSTQRNVRLPDGIEATTVAFSVDDQLLAVGEIDGDIQVYDNELNRRVARLQGHEERISDLEFSPTGHLVSGSRDRSARVWNIATGKEITVCWHIASVRDVAVAKRGSGMTLVTAIADSATGRAVVWSLTGSANKMTARRDGEFLEHDRPVSCVAIAPQGDVVATGDADGNILIWRPSDVDKTDYAGAIADAVRRINSDKPQPKTSDTKTTPNQPLIDESDASAATQLVSVQRIGFQGNVQRLRAHADIIESIQFSEDGNRLVSSSDDYTLKLWDINSRRLDKTLRGHGGWVTDARFIDDAPGRILSISRDATIRSWDSTSYVGQAATLTAAAVADTNDQRQSQAHNDEIWSARFDRSGQRIVTASRDHTARILQIDSETMSFTEVARFRDPDDQPNQLEEGTAFLAMSVAVDRSHRRLYIGSADSTVRIWDLDRGTEIAQARGTGLNSVLALSDNGRMLLTGSSSANAKAILWDVDPSGAVSPRPRIRFRGHDQAVTAFAISPDGSRVFTGDRVGLGILWDANTGRQIGDRIELLRGFRINDASFSSDGSRLLIATDDQQVTILDVARRQPVGRLKHDGFVTQISLSADGRHLLTVSESTTQTRMQSTATLWNLANGQGRRLDRVERTIANGGNSRAKGARISSARFGPQSRLAIVSRSSDAAPGELKLFTVDQASGNQEQPKTFRMPSKIGSAEVAMPISNRHMLTLNGDAAFLWDLQSMGHVMSYRAHSALTQASFSFDGRFVATGSRSVKIWDSKTGLSVGKLENPHRGPVRAVQFSPSGPRYVLATASDDGVARVWTWDPKTKEFQKIRELAIQKQDANSGQQTVIPIRSISFSTDGQSLLAVGAVGTTRLFQLGDQAVTSFDIQAPVTLTCCAFSPDGKWIAVGGDDKLARMWNVAAAAEPPILFEGHADRIEDIRILMDGSTQPRVLTASRDKSARVWDPRLGSGEKTAREVVALRRHTQGVTAIDFTPDGQTLMTAGRDGAVILWPAAKRDDSTEPNNVFDSL